MPYTCFPMLPSLFNLQLIPRVLSVLCWFIVIHCFPSQVKSSQVRQQTASPIIGIFLYPAPVEKQAISQDLPLARRLQQCHQNSCPFGVYVQALLNAVQVPGFSECTFINFFLAWLDEPFHWEERGDLKIWNYWEVVNPICHRKEMELLQEEWVPLLLFPCPSLCLSPPCRLILRRGGEGEFLLLCRVWWSQVR